MQEKRQKSEGMRGISELYKSMNTFSQFFQKFQELPLHS